MTKQEKLRLLNLSVTGPSVTTIMRPPRIPDGLKRTAQEKALWEQYEKEVDDWWESLPRFEDDDEAIEQKPPPVTTTPELVSQTPPPEPPAPAAPSPEPAPEGEGGNQPPGPAGNAGEILGLIGL